ncbi:MAG: O-antigen ligase family protein [Lentisphaerae bacterium]|nr:O-antigen ligase family protein [Lentisphaerota bacterium]
MTRPAPEKMEQWAFRCLLGSVFTAGFSLPLGRALAAASLALVLAAAVRVRRMPRLPAVTWFALLWIAIAAVATVFGVHPELGVPKLRKLLWFFVLPLTAVLVNTPARRLRLLTALAAGAGVLALQLCVVHPVRALADVRSGGAADFVSALIDAGSMTDGQRLMLGVIAALGLLALAPRTRRRRAAAWALLGATSLALVVNLKRGSWLCTLGTAALFAALKGKWRVLAAAALVVAGSLLLPPVRARLAGLPDELDAGGGGRLTMWTRITPALIRRYPAGVGYRSLTNPMMREAAPRVEYKRDHLHSNPAQVLVATGWLGFAAYLAWMLRGLADAAYLARRTARRPEPESVPALVLLLLLVALLANGLVEYNLGDAEIVLYYGFIMGAAAGGNRRLTGQGVLIESGGKGRGVG